jgi:hypothetical protein
MVSRISFFFLFFFLLSFLKFTPSHFNIILKNHTSHLPSLPDYVNFTFFFWLVLVFKKKKNKIQTMLKRKNTLAYTDIQPFINPFCQGTRTINSHQTRH